jgi:hypothetical protein
MDLLNDRARTFLTFDSLLITAFAFGRSAFPLAIVIPVLGLTTSLLWLYLGHRTLLMYGYFREAVLAAETSLPEAERVFTAEENFREERHRPVLGVRLSVYFGYGLPLILVATWLALLV